MAITERYFPPYYFDQNLMGAQADQDVLKDILNTKIPGLSQHLATLDVELSTITLNWFLAVFFESVPFDVSPNTLYLWEFLIYICIDMLFKMHNFTRDSNKGIIVQHLSLFSYLSPFEFETQLC